MGDDAQQKGSSRKARLLHELKHVGLITLYFFVCFTLIGVLKMLILSRYDVGFIGFSKVIVGALVIAKVVAVLDMTSFGERFKNHSLALFVLYRTLVYTFAVAIVLSVERIIEKLDEAGSLGGAIGAALASTDSSKFYATTLLLTLTFLGYNTVAAVSHRVGSQELVRFFFSTKPEP